MAGSGFQRSRFNYQAASATADNLGQASSTWSTVATVAGNVTPNQREVLDDMGVAIRTDVVIETAYHPSITARGRLVDVVTGAVFNIMGVVDPDGGRRKRLRITAAAVDEVIT